MNPFACRVYKVVLAIPFGEVRTYKWVARCAGEPRAYRAVGQILKSNPWPLIVPCHRVIKSDGDTGGYIFGRSLKRRLINLERQISESMV